MRHWAATRYLPRQEAAGTAQCAAGRYRPARGVLLSAGRLSGRALAFSPPPPLGMYFCQQACFPFRLFPVGEPKIESGITAPSCPFSTDLFNAGRGRRLAKPVENLYRLLQPHIA